MYRPKRNYKRSTRPYKKRVYKRRAAPKKKSFVARVKKIIHSQLENKVTSYAQANLTLANAITAGPNPTYLTMIPTMSQGTNAAQRIGNEIRVVKAHIKGFVNLLPYSSVSNPQLSPAYVKMWLCARKQTNIGTTGYPTTTDWNTFFQSGSSSLGFQGNMLDMCLKNNRDYWTIYKTKTLQLTNNNIAVSGGAAFGGSGRFSIPFSFNFVKHVGKLKYNDSTTIPNNKELFLVFQAVNSDGSLSAVSLCEQHSVTEWEYEDA